MRKPFSQDMHDAYDGTGKSRVAEHFKIAYGIDLVEHEDKYAVDLVAYKDGKKLGYVEVEVRDSWSKDEFPFDSLHIPERKEKLLNNDMRTYLVSVNKLGTKAFICDATVILNSPRMEKNNKYVEHGELFFLVDPSRIKLVNLRREK